MYVFRPHFDIELICINFFVFVSSFFFLSKISKEDKTLPHKICSVCISYMKHAVLFRKQVIDNTRWMREHCISAKTEPSYQSYAVEKLNAKRLLADDMGQSQDLWNGVNLASVATENDSFDCLNQEMALTFGGECDDSSDDEDDNENDPGASILFNYKEKCFQEDDITNFDIASKIIVTVPDEMRERKCDACRQRFMLKDTFEQHLKDCIELKLLKFITEGNQLLAMRKSRTLSANEFVRRIIFSLKKTVKSLTLCYKEVTVVAASSSMGDDKVSKKLSLIDVVGDIDKLNIGPLKKSLNNGINSPPSPMLSNDVGDIHESSRNFLNLLEGKPNVSIQINRINGTNNSNPNAQNSPIPHNFSFENKHSSTGIVTADTLGENKVPDLYGNGNTISCSALETKMFQRPMFNVGPVSKNMQDTVIAQCNSPCGESFTSPQQFKQHVQECHADAAIRSEASTPGPLQKCSTPTNDTLNTDERNKLLQMLASSSIRF